MESMARWVGIDYGDKRIGLAISDPMGIVATPLDTVENGSRDRSVATIAALIQEREIAGVVVGRPTNMDGSKGPRVQITEAFVNALTEATSVPVRWWDERLTSASVERVLIAAGTRRDKRKMVVDKLAAQQILQGFLDSLSPFPEGPLE